MKQFLAILKKEIYDNMRDKRSLFFAVLYGPVFLPLMMLGPIALGIKKHSINYDQAQVVHIQHIDAVPNLVAFLRERNIEAKPAPEDFKQHIMDGTIPLVLTFAEDYQQSLRAGKTATIHLYHQQDDDDSAKAYRRVKTELQAYGHQLTSLRLSVRGIDTRLLRPLHLASEDLSAGSEADKFLARILPFIVVLSLTMGGFYLAVDSTAGERERHSLEPLLSLCVSRRLLVLAKFCAVMCFVGISGLLAVLSSYLLFRFLPVDELAALVQVDILAFITVYLLLSPLVVFFSSSMMAIATFARNTKEAQTHLGLAMVVPMAPFFIIQFMNLKTTANLMWVPVFSQFLLIEKALVAEPLLFSHIIQSILGALVPAVLLLALTVNMYSKEKILGS